MATTGKRFADRTNDNVVRRVLDARTKSILDRVLMEQRGRSLDAYLRVFKPSVPSQK